MSKLINDQSLELNYENNRQLYQSHLMEQYKLYVEMADRVSARRNLTNVFFLSLHTTFIGIIGLGFDKLAHLTPKWLITFPILGVVTLCYVWWRLIFSYRQLNAAKYIVIGEFEKQLPTSPYYAAEWKALGEGKDNKKYFPLTHLENYIPLIFAFLYLSAWCYVILILPPQ
jgi:hypothetical protein